MMEEVSDDTNGESSFEFVKKIDEISLRDEDASTTPPEQLGASGFLPAGDTSKNFPVSVPNVAAPIFPVKPKKTESNITFYDVDPKGSQSIMLPPLVTPDPSTQITSTALPGLQSHYAHVQSRLVTLFDRVPPKKTESDITFYDVDPKSSQSIMLPSLVTPDPSTPIASTALPGLQSHYTHVQSSHVPINAPPQTFTAPPAQQPYYSSPTQYSALNLPLEPTSSIPEQQPEGGVWGWLKGKDFINKVAEKAKNSVDSVITTLDPGMKEIINSGGDICVIVASGNEDKISAVREAFQFVFGKATVQGVAVQSSSIAPQPVGFSAGLKAAEERINNLKQMGFAQDQQILLSIENFLAELTPDNWFDMGCLYLQDQSSGINLQVYTEAIPVSSQYVAVAKDQTPADYPLGWSGYAVTIGQVMGPALSVPHSLWHQALTGVSRREILFIAAKTIAGLYRSQLRR